jgi:hypothetical protein
MTTVARNGGAICDTHSIYCTQWQSFTLPHHSLWIPGPFLESWWIPGLFLPFLSIPRSPWEVLVHSHPIPSSFLVHSQNRGEWVWGGEKREGGECMRQRKGEGGGMGCEGGVRR